MNIKQIPEDFKVEETGAKQSLARRSGTGSACVIKLPKQNSAGQYTYFWLTKRNYTTTRAILSIAKALGVSFARFHFAGTKDANAVTRQLVSAFQIPPERLANLHLKDITIEVAGQFADRLALGDLSGNRFEIVLRELNKSELNNITYYYLILKKNKYYYLNYFGEQRFGGGNSALVGREIIRGYFRDAVYYLLTYSEKKNKEASKFRQFAKKNFGVWDKILERCPKFLGIETTALQHLINAPNDFAGALRKLPKPIRRMYVHAYQSYLWNAGLASVKGNQRKLQKQFSWPRKSRWIFSGLKKAYLIPGYKTKLGKDKFSKKIKELLEKDNLALDSFKCERMPELASEGASRPALVKAKHFEIADACFRAILKGYSSSPLSQQVLQSLKKVESRGRYKSQT